MKWQIRFLKNALLGVLPIAIQEKARKAKRGVFPHDLHIDFTTIKQGLQQVNLLREAGCDPIGKDYAELGTGWSPVIPIIFSLTGCSSLTLIDGQRLMDAHTFQETCKQLVSHSDLISVEIGVDVESIKATLEKLASLELDSALNEMNCKYLAPYNLLENDLPDSSIDIVTSRAVLEHVPPEIVKNMFFEFHRLLRNDGAMCHIVDNSDHWEHQDKTLRRLNYLKYSQRTFDFISSLNPLDYQNRLRHSQYIELMNNASFEIVNDDSPPDPTSLADLEKLKIHESFGGYSNDDLAILTSNLVARKSVA